MNSIYLRLIAVLFITGIGVIGFTMVNMILLKRANRTPVGLEFQRPKTPAILYFTTPDCLPCRSTQRPAISRLLEISGEQVQLIEVDASAQAKLADSWGVLSVPTTFVIDSAGRPRQVNHGVTSTEKLLRQLEQAEGRSLSIDLPLQIQALETGAPATD